MKQLLIVLLCGILAGCGEPKSAEWVIADGDDVREIKTQVSENAKTLDDIKGAIWAIDSEPVPDPEFTEELPPPEADEIDLQPEPKEEPNAKIPEHAVSSDRDRYRVYVFHAPWCGWCPRWEANEQDKIDCQVERHNIDIKPVSWVKSIPAVQLEWKQGDKWVWINRWQGYTSAEVINRAIQDHRQKQLGVQKQAANPIAKRISVGGAKSSSGQIRVKSKVKVRRSRGELEQWAAQNYNLSSMASVTQHATVQPLNQVRNHLVNEHGFSREQVQGLPLMVALALHDAAHIGTISSWQ